MKTLKTDNKIIDLLKVKELSRVIAFTDKGTLVLQLRKGSNKYHLVLDAVPLEQELNDELMALIYPAPITEIPQVNKEPVLKVNKEGTPPFVVPNSEPKKKGSPAKK